MKSGFSNRSSSNNSQVKGSGLLTIEQVEIRRNFLTQSQLALFVLAGYYILALLYYSILGDNIKPLNTIYFATQTLTSVGYGDINSTLSNKHYSFTAFFCLTGAGLVAVHFSFLASNLVQQQEQALKNGLNKIHEKIKEHVIQDNEKVMTVQELEEGLIKNKNRKIDVAELYNELFNQELREIRSAVLLNLLLVLIVLLVGGAIFGAIEGYSYTASVYWACATVTTTGYGDIVATTDNGKIFSIIYMLSSVGIALKGFAEIVRYPIVLRAKKNELEVSKQFITHISPSTIKNILKNDFFDRIENLRKSPGVVQKSEFVLMLLQMMGKTSEKDIVFMARVFDSLDTNGCGEINEEQLNAVMIEAKEKEKIRLLEQQKELEQGLGLGLGLDNLAIGALGDITTGLGSLGSAVGSGLGSLTMGMLGKKDSHQLSTDVDNPIHGPGVSYKNNYVNTNRRAPKSSPSNENNNENSTPQAKSTSSSTKIDIEFSSSKSNNSQAFTPQAKSSEMNNSINDLMDVDLLSQDEVIQSNINTESTVFNRPHGYTAIEHLGSDLIDYSIDSDNFGEDVLSSPITQVTITPKSEQLHKGARKLDL